MGWLSWLIYGSAVIGSLILSITQGSSWAFTIITTMFMTILVSNATFGIGNWMIVQFLASILPIPAWAIDAIKNGGFIAQLGAKRVAFFISIVESVLVFPINLVLLWLLNFVILQVSILIECRKINGKTLRAAAGSALSGSLAGAIVALAWGILASIPIFIGQILTAIEIGVYTFSFGLLVIPSLLMVIHNIAFGALGNAIAISVGCEGEGFESVNSNSHSTVNSTVNLKVNSKVNYGHNHNDCRKLGKGERCRCMCCKVCNSKV